ncbi:hypothetical protein BpHYR1_021808 [Brachionus plicatilis]|uniref:Uncharacterized protein n=1 Tax=Brachionus plicatilis TaxID=10195 RepID=A0A3M7PSD6_BRAPC|nr:hypothetical protein BpHYR1_021808 [Brachionus plicatilis]
MIGLSHSNVIKKRNKYLHKKENLDEKGVKQERRRKILEEKLKFQIELIKKRLKNQKIKFHKDIFFDCV